MWRVQPGAAKGGRPISFASVEVAVGRWGSACVCVDMWSRGVAGEALAAGWAGRWVRGSRGVIAGKISF